jgi:hypothetical protein
MALKLRILYFIEKFFFSYICVLHKVMCPEILIFKVWFSVNLCLSTYLLLVNPIFSMYLKCTGLTSSVTFLHQDNRKSRKHIGGIRWNFFVTNYYFQQQMLSNILHKTDNTFTVQVQN